MTAILQKPQKELAISWLLNSKIHNTDGSDPMLFGSFNNFYDLRKKTCQYAYTEITAYAVELLIDLFEMTGNDTYLEIAESSADWIIQMQCLEERQERYGGYFHCVCLDGRKGALESYPFDAGVILGALTELYKKTKKEKYLNSAALGAKWLCESMQNSDGSFKPFSPSNEQLLTAPKVKVLRNSWYHLSGCHHGKIAIGLLKYYQQSEEPRALDSAKLLLEWLVTQQNTKGYFKTSVNSNAFFSHTHCYATEALLFAHDSLRQQDYIDAATKAADYLVRYQLKDGSIISWENALNPLKYVDISAIAQSVRIWSVIYSQSGDIRYKAAMDKAMRYLARMQNMEDNLDSKGGFYLVDFDLGLLRYKLKRLYSWATIFGIHAMILSSDSQSASSSGSQLW